ncbi:hypothetical protein GFS03_05620 [Sulfolobus sp. E5-1-F]|uniref:hypothetical protein n=1 Tax=Sulfolobaceae TaxID=118883 RepID=UPI001296B1CB|nr:MULTISPECIES: hypothetical protein [unclassified Sulfolobus]QGA54083.1 hypothetical protein GFS03_05620 [Sulfolobus sp. E5-1-F]QGA69145.1 hypothetical protein GFS33_10920 [Sulfolobus sp. E11-6]
MILLYLISLMILVHLIGSIISFLGKTFPKRVGNIIAIYEIVFYIIVVIFYPNMVTVLLAIGYLYLVIHVIGGILYIKGSLHKIYSNPNELLYYGIYEFVEMIYLISLLIELVV